MNTPGSVAKLVSGERPLMMYILTNHLGDALRKGAPLEFKIPASGAVPFYFSGGLLKNARHPNAAKLYLEFLLSEGQDVISNTSALPSVARRIRSTASFCNWRKRSPRIPASQSL